MHNPTNIHQYLNINESGIAYAIPRIGTHRKWKCLLGNHWLSVVYNNETEIPIGFICGACRKIFKKLHKLPEYALSD